MSDARIDISKDLAADSIHIGGDVVERGKVTTVYNVAGNLFIHAAQSAYAERRDLRAMLRVLVIAAAPVMGRDPSAPPPARLNLRAEWKRLADAVRNSGAPIALIRLTPPTLDALRYALSPRALEQELAPHVVHFTGHGWDEGLLFEDECGRARPTPARDLVEIFRQAQVKLGVFNACETAAEVYSIARVLVDSGALQAAIGHIEPVYDVTAIQFAARLYAELAQGGTDLNEAMRHAHQVIANRPDAYNPQMIGDGALTLPAPRGGTSPLGGGEPYIHDGQPPGALPDGAEVFFGRGTELVDLAERLAQDDGRVVVMSGVSGIGKSALALEAAHRNAWRFPGGVTWVTGPRTPDQAKTRTANALLTNLALGLQLEVKPDQDPALVLVEHCARNPTLLVMDNLELLARDAPAEIGRMAEFLHSFPHPSHAIVTLIQPLLTLESLPNVTLVRMMEGLGKDAATEHVRYQANVKQVPELGNPSAAQRLAEQLHGHPLMIEFAVPIARRPGGYARLMQLVANLSGELGQKLQNIIGWSVELLRQPGKDMHAHLPLFPAASCTLEAANAALNADALEGLTDLFDAGLVDYRAPRYTWHQSVMDYALRYVSLPAEPSVAKLRLAEYYSKWGNENQDNFDVLETEHPNMLAALDWAWNVARNAPDEVNRQRATKAIVHDCMGLRAMWRVRGYWQERLTWLERAAQVGKNSPENLKSHIDNLHNLATAHSDIGDYSTARDLYRQAYVICEQLGDRQGLASTLHDLAYLAQSTSDYRTANDLYEQARAIYKQLGNLQGLASTLHNLANLYKDIGNYPAAHDLWQQARQIRKQIGDHQGLAATLNNLATLALSTGDYSAARNLYQETLTIVEQLGDRKGLSTVLHNLGQLAQASRDYLAAREFYQRSRQIKERLGDRHGLAATLYALAMLSQATGDYPAAYDLFQQAHAIFEKVGDRRGLANTLHQTGVLEEELGKPTAARKLVEQSLAIKKEIGDPSGIAVSLMTLGQLAERYGNPQEAIHLYNQSLLILRELRSPRAREVEQMLKRVERRLR
jgi:tetratricopeptide (TPR) repeat protein